MGASLRPDDPRDRRVGGPLRRWLDDLAMRSVITDLVQPGRALTAYAEAGQATHPLREGR